MSLEKFLKDRYDMETIQEISNDVAQSVLPYCYQTEALYCFLQDKLWDSIAESSEATGRPILEIIGGEDMGATLNHNSLVQNVVWNAMEWEALKIIEGVTEPQISGHTT